MAVQRVPGEGELERYRAPVETPIALRFEYFSDFIHELSANISMGGMFVKMARPRAPGARFDFEFKLGDDFTLIRGRGEVVWNREAAEGSDRPAGMGVRFVELDPTSRRVIERMVQQHVASGQEAFVLQRPVQGDGEEPRSAEDEESPESVVAETESPAATPEEIDAGRTVPGDVEAAMAEIRRLRQEADARQSVIEHLRAELERSRRERSEWEASHLREVETAKRAEGEARRRLEVALGELRTGERAVAELKRLQERTVPDLEQRLRSAEAEAAARAAELEAERDRAREEVARADESASEAESGLEAERSRATELAEELATARRQIGDLERRLEAANSRDAEREQELRQATVRAEQLERVRGELKRSETARRQGEETARAAADEASAAARRVDELRSRLAEVEGERDEGRRRLETLEEEAASLRDEAGELRARFEGGQAEVARLAGSAVKARTLQEDLRREADRLRRELKEARRQRGRAGEGGAAASSRTGGTEGGVATQREAEPSRPTTGGKGARGWPVAAAAGLAAGVLLTLLWSGGVRESAPRIEEAGTVGEVAPVAPAEPRVPMPAAELPSPAESPPAEPPALDAADVGGPGETAAERQRAAREALEAWAASWSAQDVDAYLAHYARGFVPPDGLDRTAWRRQRRQRLERPGYIRITLASVEAAEIGPERLRLRFSQSYESDTYSDRVAKVVEMVREQGSWKIAVERPE